MDIDDEFQDEEVRQKVSFLVQEYEELFGRIRDFTRSDVCAWFVVQAWIDWKRIDRIQSERKRKGDRPISEAQLRELRSRGMESLADLSRKEAQALIDGLTPISPEVGAEEEEGGWY
jgi:hypothetical protein